MRSFIYRAHIWLAFVVALPVLAWTSSGLLYAWPNVVEGGKVERIDTTRIRVSLSEALSKANEFAGRNLPTTALTLLMRDGRPVYQAIGGMGADSLLIDAETGAVVLTPHRVR
ncbi:MAG TPA: PepSY domain-containing protein [Pyrinomonadaceae bacterium]|nr:PepSY domain-containing protein [Pyrinomonadaceae bacterium]